MVLDDIYIYIYITFYMIFFDSGTLT